MNTKLDEEYSKPLNRLLAKNESSTRVEEFEREKFLLEVKLKEIAEKNPGVAVIHAQP